MTDPLAVRVPLVNPNEPEAWIAALHVAEGDEVRAGDVMATLETTKSTVELEAERAGYVAGLRGEVGQQIRAGAVLCWISNTPEWEPPSAEEPAAPAPTDLRLTDPARALAERMDLDLEQLARGVLITEAKVRQIAAEREVGGVADLPEANPNTLLVYGGGGHGKAVIELIRAVGGLEVVGVVDDGIPAGTHVMGVEVIGGGERLADLRGDGVGLAVNAVGGIGDIGSRVDVFQRLRAAHFEFPTLVHPTAFVEPSAELAQGVQIFPHAYVGSQAGLGFGVIVNTSAVVSHDCRLEDYVNVAPGSMLAGDVRVGAQTLIGMGVTVNLSVRIGQGARLGNSAVVKDDVPAGAVVRAGGLWPTDGREGS